MVPIFICNFFLERGHYVDTKCIVAMDRVMTWLIMTIKYSVTCHFTCFGWSHTIALNTQNSTHVYLIYIWAMSWESQLFAYAKTKRQISFAVTWIVRYHFFCHTNYQASSHLLYMHSPVSVGPAWKLWRPVFSEQGSFLPILIVRSAREAEVLENRARDRGETLPTEKRFDSNCITPGRWNRHHLSRNVRKPTMWFLTRSDTNQAVQLLQIARGLKFWI